MFNFYIFVSILANLSSYIFSCGLTSTRKKKKEMLASVSTEINIAFILIYQMRIWITVLPNVLFLSLPFSYLTGGDIALSSISCEKLQALPSVYAFCSHASQFKFLLTNGQVTYSWLQLQLAIYSYLFSRTNSHLFSRNLFKFI